MLRAGAIRRGACGGGFMTAGKKSCRCLYCFKMRLNGEWGIRWGPESIAPTNKSLKGFGSFLKNLPNASPVSALNINLSAPAPISAVCALSFGPLKALSLRVPCVATHVVERKLRAPAQLALGFGGVGVTFGDVARAAGSQLAGDFDGVDPLECAHDLVYTAPPTRAEVKNLGHARSMAFGPVERRDMPAREVDNMDIVAHRPYRRAFRSCRHR